MWLIWLKNKRIEISRMYSAILLSYFRISHSDCECYYFSAVFPNKWNSILPLNDHSKGFIINSLVRLYVWCTSLVLFFQIGLFFLFDCAIMNHQQKI